jgi:hypothetical protein
MMISPKRHKPEHARKRHSRARDKESPHHHENKRYSQNDLQKSKKNLRPAKNAKIQDVTVVLIKATKKPAPSRAFL